MSVREFVDRARAAGKKVISMAFFPHQCEHAFESIRDDDHAAVERCPKCTGVAMTCVDPMLVPTLITAHYPQ